MAIKLHVEPDALRRKQPALVVQPDGHNRWPLTTHIGIRCHACNAVAAQLVQLEEFAHVVVETAEVLDVAPEVETATQTG